MDMILLVDDSSSIRTVCKSELERDGYRVVLATDGREAVTKVRQFPPDLVILDIRMRHTNGLDAMVEIDRWAPGVPIIVFSNEGEDYRRRRNDLPPHTYLHKTGDLAELKVVVAATLAQTACHANEGMPVAHVHLFELLESLEVGGSARAVLLDWRGDDYIRTNKRITVHDFVGRHGQPGSRGYCVPSPNSRRWEVMGGLAAQEYHPVGFIL